MGISNASDGTPVRNWVSRALMEWKLNVLNQNSSAFPAKRVVHCYRGPTTGVIHSCCHKHDTQRRCFGQAELERKSGLCAFS